MNYIEIDMRTNRAHKEENDDLDELQDQKSPFSAHEIPVVDDDPSPELHIIPPAKEKQTPPPSSTPDKFPNLPGLPQPKNTDNSPEIN